MKLHHDFLHLLTHSECIYAKLVLKYENKIDRSISNCQKGEKNKKIMLSSLKVKIVGKQIT